MLALLPVICFGLGAIILRAKLSGWREAILASAVIYGVAITVSTEVLSLFERLQCKTVLAFWILIAFVGGYYAFLLRPQRRYIHIGFLLKKFSFSEIFLISWVLFIILAISLSAWIAPPNNWDSMTYHMSRLSHWIQNQSVAHYSSHIIRQLTYPPWAEWAILHLQLLAGNDRWANSVQWVSMIISLIASSLIAKELGAHRKGQIYTAVLACSLPMGILQASSTQNDYVVTLWLLCFLYFSLRALHGQLQALSPFIVFITGASLGLALLTKGTAYIFALPFLGWFAIKGITTYGPKFIKPFISVMIIALILNSGYYTRNFHLTGHFLPHEESPQVTVEKIRPSSILSNTLRNIALELATPFPRLNDFIEKIVHKWHALSGLSIDDPQTTMGGAFRFAGHPFHEDHAGNPLYLLLLLTLLCSYPFLLRHKLPSILTWYLTIGTIGLGLFSVLLKWQPWSNRLHLPGLIILTPALGLSAERLLKPKITLAILMTLSLCALPWVFRNQSRPLIGSKNIFTVQRLKQYFTNRPSLQNPYTQTTQYIQNQTCSKIGLILGEDSWEYPFWVLLSNSSPSFRIQHIDVSNVSSCLAMTNFNPCFIIDLKNSRRHKITFHRRNYVQTRRFSFINIFQRDDTGHLAQKNMLEHLRLRRIYAYQARTIKGPESLAKKVDIYKQELNEALLIDPDELNRLSPELGRIFQETLLKGLKLRLTGLATGQKKLYSSGERLIMEWEKNISYLFSPSPDMKKP